MKYILTALILLPLSSFAMQKSEARFPVKIFLTQGDHNAEKSTEISLNKEASIVFDSFKGPDPDMIKFAYTVKLLALKHSTLSFMNRQKETVNVKGMIEREVLYSGSRSGTVSGFQKDFTINERKNIEPFMMAMYGKFVLGVTVGPQLTAPQAKL